VVLHGLHWQQKVGGSVAACTPPSECMKVVLRDSRKEAMQLGSEGWWECAFMSAGRPCSGTAEGWWECGCLHAAQRVHEGRAAEQQKGQRVLHGLHSTQRVQEAMQRGSEGWWECLHARRHPKQRTLSHSASPRSPTRSHHVLFKVQTVACGHS